MDMHRIVTVMVGLILSSAVFADWQVQFQNKNGSWQGSYTRATEDAARAMANIECSRGKHPLKIVDTISGKEHALYCDPRVGKITDDGKPAPVVLLTESEVSEHAEKAQKLCQNNSYLSSMFDCDCLVEKTKVELRQSEGKVVAGTILHKVARESNECIDRAGVYEYTYTPCVSVLESTRPHNAEAICGCATDATLEGFIKAPVLSLRSYEGLRNAALQQCIRGKKAE